MYGLKWESPENVETKSSFSPFNFTGDVGNNTLYPRQGTKARLINYGEAVEIVFQGTNVGNAENHPMHLHGFSFIWLGQVMEISMLPLPQVLTI